MASLFIVASPIGNLDDITLRAIQTLKDVDVIACEDTRHSQKLLNHFGIQKKTIACHSHNQRNSANGIIKLLEENRSVAYLSDAGTPGLSDPGSLLVTMVAEAGFEVIPIPGVSAFATLLSISGSMGKDVHFEGFLSVKSGKRRKRIEELMERNEAFVVYESPYRILKVLAECADIDSERQIVVGREMTKRHEEYLRGSALEVYENYNARQSIKGEFSVLVSPAKKG